MRCLNCHSEMVERVAADPGGARSPYDICDALWWHVVRRGRDGRHGLPSFYRSVEASSRGQADGVSEPLRQCPRCENQPLLKAFFLAYSDILLDHCENCHGFWLDGGEFKRINEELSGLKSEGGGDLKPFPQVPDFLLGLWGP